jgi:hypothetical protein
MFADKSVVVLPANASTSSTVYSTTTLTSVVFPPIDSDPTTTTLSRSQGAMQLNDVIALINSWADQSSYPPA